MPVIIEFNINGQVLTPKNTNPSIVAKSKNLYKLKFNMPDIWKKLSFIHVLFSKSGQTFEVNLENGECMLPNQLYQSTEGFDISLYGGDRITSTIVALEILDSGYTTETSASTPSSSTDIAVLTPSTETTVSKLKYDGMLKAYIGSQWKTFMTAYQSAVAGGYTGTETQFCNMLNSITQTIDRLSTYSGTHEGFSTLAEELEAEGMYYSGTTGVAGVEIDFTNATSKRIGASSWMSSGDNYNCFNCFGGRKRCNLTDDGTVIAYAGDDNFTNDTSLSSELTIGSQTFAAGTQIQTMVEQPAFWYRFVPIRITASQRGYAVTKFRLYISDSSLPGFKIHPAFIKNGEISDKIYLSAYDASIYDVSESAWLTKYNSYNTLEDKLSSVASKDIFINSILNDIGITEYIQLVQNRGAGWSLAGPDTISATRMLMMTEYASYDIQAALGNGVSTSPSVTQTGTTTTLLSSSGKSSTDDNASISYRGEENIYSSYNKYIYGIQTISDSNGTTVRYKCSYTNDSYVSSNITLAESTGYVNSVTYSTDADWLLLPASTSASVTGAACNDKYTVSDTSTSGMMIFGGCSTSQSEAGIFNFSKVQSDLNSNIACARIIYK